MTIAESMTTLDKVLISILAAAALIAILTYWSARTARPGAHRPDRIEREVEQALTDPAYAPYGADLNERTRDVEDYAIRAQKHQQCDAYPCPHPQWRTEPPQPILADHCRCGAPWVCELAGPLNQPRSHFDDDKRDFYRNYRDTGRWDS